jgi:ribonuclease P protein component
VALPQRHRLRGRRVFDRLYRHGRRYQGSCLMLRVVTAETSLLPPGVPAPASPWRCGVVVSRKVSKLAVHRNRLRRLLHQHLLSHPPTPERPVWLLLTLHPGCLELGDERLLGECTRLLGQAGWRLDPSQETGGQGGEQSRDQ